MGAKLLGMPAGPPLYAALNKIWGHFIKMRDAMPYLKEQSQHVVGFFEGAHASGGTATTANTFQDVMSAEFSFQEINKPVMVFEIQDFRSGMVKKLAAELAHELGHALGLLNDRMNVASGNTLYATTRDNVVDLAPLMAAARRPGNPTGHAATVEHFLVMAAALLRENTRASVMAYIAAGSSYARTFTDRELAEMLEATEGLAASILNLRRKRARRGRSGPIPAQSFPAQQLAGGDVSRRAAGKPPAAARRQAQSSARITSAPRKSLYRPN
jgi:hypothetical protein